MANQTFTQVADVFNLIANQATGKASLSPTNTNEFMSIATTLYNVGYDKLMNAITQVLARTIFSERAYQGKFASMQVDTQRWGQITRKLSMIDDELTDDPTFELVDGSSVDMYKVRLPKPLQVNFYGSSVFKKYYTVLVSQLDECLRGVDEFQSFWAMVTQNNQNILTQNRENTRRALLANAIAATNQYGGNEQNIHLLTEYNSFTGQSLTYQTVMQGANYRPFMQWVYARINELSEMMSERSELYHLNITGKTVKRFSDKRNQRVYLYTPMKFQAQAMADANTYNDQFVGFASNESVNFWQSIKSPDTVKVDPAYLDVSDGSVKAHGSAITVSKVMGCIFDEEALGTTVFYEKMLATPVNADGLYSNIFHHNLSRYWLDQTENIAVLYLD